jgi:hypothetical protein
MNTRLTVDLQDPSLMTHLRVEAAREGKALRDIVVEALQDYLSHKRENQAVMKLAEGSFSEWDNPKDSEYDRL